MKEKMSDSLLRYIDAGRPLIYINHFDFETVDRMLEEAFPKATIAEYCDANGWIDFKTKQPHGSTPYTLPEFLMLFNNDQLYQDRKEYLVVLKEIHDSIGDKQVYSLLQSIARRKFMRGDSKGYNVTVLIVDSKLVIPPELEKLITMVELRPPQEEEIRELLNNIASENLLTIDEDSMTELVMAFSGLSVFEIKQIANLALATDGEISRHSKKLILSEKKQAIQKSGLLELIEPGDLEIGGLENLKEYLQNNKAVFNNPGIAASHGIDMPAGVMIVGMPGCGKSLTAKCISKEFGVPLLRLDIGRLMGKYVGESEENLRKAIRVAEATTPCILWIDEIEKAFAGLGSGGEVTTRLFGQFLTWMQEKKSAIYVVATANDISNLPPEFLRRGRFDEIFQVRFPNIKEREAIFKIQLEKRNGKRLPDGVDPHALAAMLKDQDNYSGADIESIVKEAMKRAFVDGQRKVTQQDLQEIIRNTKSSYQSQKEKLDKMLEKLNSLGVKPASR